MKKIILVILMLFLVSCDNQMITGFVTYDKHDNELSTESKIDDLEIDNEILINYKQVREIKENKGYYGVDGVVNHNYVDSFNYGIEIILENNQIQLRKDGKVKQLQSQNNIIALADVWNCGGDPMIYALDDCGDVYYVDYEGYDDAKLVKLNLDQKIKNLAIFNDTSPLTTCGGDRLYAQLEDNLFYIIHNLNQGEPYLGNVREIEHPYIEYLSVVDSAYENNNDNKMKYMFFNSDGTASLGYYENYEEAKLFIEDELLKDDDGNNYHFTKMVFGPYDNVLEKKMLYLIDINDNAYGIEVTSKTDEYPGLVYLGKATKVIIQDKEYLKITQE